MSVAILCENMQNCGQYVKQALYATDGRTWIEAVDRLDSSQTLHFDSIECLAAFFGAEPIVYAPGDPNTPRAIAIRKAIT